MVSNSWRTLRSARWVCIALPLLIGCEQLKLQNPNPPNTAGLQAVYDSPPGTLSAPDLTTVAETVVEQTEVLSTTDDFSLAQELLDGISSEDKVVKQGEQIDPTAGAKLLAVVQVKRICRGPEGDDVIDEEQFGTISMTLKASPRGITPIAWGRFNRCVEHNRHGVALTLDGDYSITSRKDEGGRTVLFQFNGTIETSDVDFEGEIDFRVRGGMATELRVKATNGDVVVAVNRDGHLFVRDAASEWQCDPLAVECIEEGSGDVLSAERAP